MAAKVPTELRGLCAKAALYDELVEHLAVTEDQLEQARRGGAEVDPAWREIATALAGALRPYTLFRKQRVIDGRIVVETAVPGSTLRAAREALYRLGRHVALEPYRSPGTPGREDAEREAA